MKLDLIFIHTTIIRLKMRGFEKWETSLKEKLEFMVEEKNGVRLKLKSQT